MLLRLRRASSMSINLSLTRIRKLIARFPPYTRPTIHVTGTNGKGSVTALVGSILHKSGLKVGRFNSPHLVHVWDSILIGEEPITKERYYQTRSIIERANEPTQSSEQIPKSEKRDEMNANRIGATLFEILTTTVLRIFEEEAVDLAIIEVGMGGRLDSTNILPEEGVVKVSAITSVDIDHAQWLGSTVSEIAKEKAGISRRSVPFVIGPQKWEEVEGIVKQIAEESGAPTVLSANVSWNRSGNHFEKQIPPKFPPAPQEVLYTPRDGNDTIHLQLPLHGEHQLDNLSTALGIIESLKTQNGYSKQITPATISSGVWSARWPGRLTFFNYRGTTKQYNILVDGAHNESSLRALRRYLDRFLPENHPVNYILALSHSPPKTPENTLGTLLRKGDRAAVVGFSPVEDMPWVKPVDVQEAAKVVRALVGPEGEVMTLDPGSLMNIQQLPALLDSLEWASQKSGLVVITGSLYLVADFYRLVANSPNSFKSL